MKRKTIDLATDMIPGKYYHIIHQCIDGTKLFYRKSNYLYFNKLIGDYLTPIIDLKAVILNPKEIHLVFRLKKAREFSGKIDHSDYLYEITDLFRCMFMRYAKAINKQQHRRGSLFRRRFKRFRIKKRNLSACINSLKENIFPGFYHRILIDLIKKKNKDHEDDEQKGSREPITIYRKTINENKSFIIKDGSEISPESG